MKNLLTLALALGFTTAVIADPYTGAMKRAKTVSGQVSERQQETMGAMQPAQAQPQPQPAAPPAQNPALMAMQQNISSIAADLLDLQKNPARKQSLMNNLNVAAQGKAASKTSVSKLADDLSAALTGKNLSQEQRTKLAQFLRAAFNGSHVAAAQEKTILDEVQKVLQTAGIPADAATKIAADFKTIIAETK